MLSCFPLRLVLKGSEFHKQDVDEWKERTPIMVLIGIVVMQNNIKIPLIVSLLNYVDLHVNRGNSLSKFCLFSADVQLGLFGIVLIGL